jgi:hypothetical protein
VGLFKKVTGAAGHVDHRLIERGLLARGVVTECNRTAFSTGNQVGSVVCDLVVTVDLPGHAPYVARCKHPIQIPYLSQFESGQGAVAVRVDPDDLTNIALDLEHDVPAPSQPPIDSLSSAQPQSQPDEPSEAMPVIHTADPSVGGTAGLLASGVPARAILLGVVDLGEATTSTGKPATGLVLSVTVAGRSPYQAQAGLFVPPEAASLLNIGADLPAKALPDMINMVAIDWDAALAEAAGAPHADLAADPTAGAAPSSVSAGGSDLATSLTQLAALHDSGALSDDEFARAKAALLSAG